MKEEKVNWFTKNSNWLFVVLLIIAIIDINILFDRFKLLFRYGLDFSTQWPFLLLILLYIIILVFLILFLYFLIYLEDYLHNRNKRKLRIYDAFIKKFINQGEKIEKE